MNHLDDNPKPQPPAADPIAKMFGISGGTDDRGDARVTSAPPGDLPIIEAAVVQQSAAVQSQESKSSTVSEADAATAQESNASSRSAEIDAADKIAADIAAINKSTSGAVIKIIKAVAPYLAIFVIGIFVYYYFLSSSTFSFSTLFRRPTSIAVQAQSSKAKALAQREKTDAAAYTAWISQFFFDVSDSHVIDPNTDYSGNGLTNFQKYLLNLNPKIYDSIGKGYPDGITVANGLDPATAKPLEGSRKDIVDTYFDTQEIRDRVTSSNLNGGPGTSMGVTPGVESSSTDQSTATDAQSSASGGGSVLTAQPAAVKSVATKTATPVAKAADGSAYENVLAINLNIPGTLRISKLGVSAPLYFSKSVNAMYDDLEHGVAHFTGTPLPGDHGTSTISGHSSNYFWDKGKFNKVFVSLDKLVIGDTFTITVTLQNGSQKVLNYEVVDSGQYTPDDPRQFINYAASQVALSTCWPPQTTAKRLVVRGKLKS